MTARQKASPAPMLAGRAGQQKLTRRGFVTLIAAGSAAWLAQPALAAPNSHTRRKHTRAPAHQPLPGTPPPLAPPPSAAQTEFDRQRASTLATLKTLREHPLPPGGDLPVVFRPQRTRKQGR